MVFFLLCNTKWKYLAECPEALFHELDDCSWWPIMLHFIDESCLPMLLFFVNSLLNLTLFLTYNYRMTFKNLQYSEKYISMLLFWLVNFRDQKSRYSAKYLPFCSRDKIKIIQVAQHQGEQMKRISIFVNRDLINFDPWGLSVNLSQLSLIL